MEAISGCAADVPSVTGRKVLSKMDIQKKGGREWFGIWMAGLKR
jgi:hypothetical protein